MPVNCGKDVSASHMVLCVFSCGDVAVAVLVAVCVYKVAGSSMSGSVDVEVTGASATSGVDKPAGGHPLTSPPLQARASSRAFWKGSRWKRIELMQHGVPGLDQFRHVNISLVQPRVLFIAITLPCNKKLKFPPEDAAV